MANVRYLLIVVIGLAVSGCISRPLATPQPSMQALEVLRSSDMPAMRVGTFALAPGLPASLDKSVTIRSVTLVSPNDNSFAKYLGKALETNLQAAGKLDANSDLVFEGLLTQSDVDAGIGTGTASLGAKFSLLRGGKPVFEKDLVVHSRWDSSFIGAIAIPEAINQYTALYGNLISELMADKDVKTAARAQ
jgi:hypothetical protein